MTHQKFMFDRSFDVEEPAKKAAEVAEEIEEEPEVVIPTFSEEQVETSRKEGLEQGKSEALKEAAMTIENQIIDLTKAIGAQLTELISSQSLVNNEIFRDAIKISRAITKKSFPSINAEHGVHEIEQLIRQILNQILEEPRVKIQVHPSLTEQVSERLNELSTDTHFEGRVHIMADEAIEQGDCRIDWSNGGAERNLENVMREVDVIINANLATLDEGFKLDPDAIEDDTIEPLQSLTDVTNESSPETQSQLTQSEEELIKAEAENTELKEPQPGPHANAESNSRQPDHDSQLEQKTAKNKLHESKNQKVQ
jgi:flagellar assembly protein FliH